MPKKFKRKAKKTVLIVGEGTTEQAFLEYLKSLYIERNCGISVKVIAASGGSPACIVGHAINFSANKAYDKTVVLMDTDTGWGRKVRSEARKKKIVLIGSNPCIEGLILKILDSTVHPQSRDCKRECCSVFTGKLTQKETYAEKLSKDVLEEKKLQIEELDSLLSFFS